MSISRRILLQIVEPPYLGVVNRALDREWGSLQERVAEVRRKWEFGLNRRLEMLRASQGYARTVARDGDRPAGLHHYTVAASTQHSRLDQADIQNYRRWLRALDYFERTRLNQTEGVK